MKRQVGGGRLLGTPFPGGDDDTTPARTVWKLVPLGCPVFAWSKAILPRLSLLLCRRPASLTRSSCAQSTDPGLACRPSPCSAGMAAAIVACPVTPAASPPGRPDAAWFCSCLAAGRGLAWGSTGRPTGAVAAATCSNSATSAAGRQMVGRESGSSSTTEGQAGTPAAAAEAASWMCSGSGLPEAAWDAKCSLVEGWVGVSVRDRSSFGCQVAASAWCCCRCPRQPHSCLRLARLGQGWATQPPGWARRLGSAAGRGSWADAGMVRSSGCLAAAPPPPGQSQDSGCFVRPLQLLLPLRRQLRLRLPTRRLQSTCHRLWQAAAGCCLPPLQGSQPLAAAVAARAAGAAAALAACLSGCEQCRNAAQRVLQLLPRGWARK